VPIAPASEPAPPRPEASAAAFARAALEHATASARAVAGVEEQLLELALAIAAAIVEREVERDSLLHAALARSALETLGDSAGAKLRASHDAYAAILDALGAPLIVVDGVTVQVTLDPTLEGVGCVVENEHGRVDSRIAERLRAVRRALDDERRRRDIEEAG
jgi:flagellar assembly protein FliH